MLLSFWLSSSSFCCCCRCCGGGGGGVRCCCCSRVCGVCCCCRSCRIRSELTNAVDEDAGQDEVEDVEQGSPADADDVGDVRVGLRAARVVLHVLLGVEADQVELAVGLVVGHVAVLGLLHQVQLKVEWKRAQCQGQGQRSVRLRRGEARRYRL